MSVVSLDPSASRVQPPEDLNKEEAKAFRDLVTVRRSTSPEPTRR
jgi:hypothetical protein